ncbi:restriction endonuclease [Candidatus Woesearchaeota archaeon]|nr:restriction endonuclease [Candidatus Woesearchaeota archaeon]
MTGHHPQGRRFEESIELLLSALQYHSIEAQVRTPAIMTRGEARKRWPSKAYIPTPRFDLVARRPVTFRKVYVECKSYSRSVPKTEVQEFLYRLDLCEIPRSRGLIVAQPQLTAPAYKEAIGAGIHVWHGQALKRRLIVEAVMRPSPTGLPVAAYRSARYILGMN